MGKKILALMLCMALFFAFTAECFAGNCCEECVCEDCSCCVTEEEGSD